MIIIAVMVIIIWATKINVEKKKRRIVTVFG